jgi:hypothetical protein
MDSSYPAICGNLLWGIHLIFRGIYVPLLGSVDALTLSATVGYYSRCERQVPGALPASQTLNGL